MDVPKRLLGKNARVGSGLAMEGYPLFYGLSYDICEGSIGREECVFVAPKSPMRLPSLLKVVGNLERDRELPCVVVSDEFSRYQIRRLTEENIAWVASEEAFYLPFAGLSLRGFREKGRPTHPLSAQAQRLAVRIIDGTWRGRTATEISALMGRSLASVSGYIKEIEAIAPSVFDAVGRTRVVREELGATTSELLDVFEPFLVSPVKESFHLCFTGDPVPLVERGFRLSGITALSRISMLGDDSWFTCAISAGNRSLVEDLSDEIIYVSKEDGPDAKIEVWSYDIDSDGECVDDLSLYLSLKAEAEEDPRVEGALDELRGRICS